MREAKEKEAGNHRISIRAVFSEAIGNHDTIASRFQRGGSGDGCGGGKQTESLLRRWLVKPDSRRDQ